MEQLKLDNQICFPFYTISRLIIRAYQPYLENLEITYPQYLVLLVLWEKDEVPVQHLTEKLILNTNTVTPLLKRMESIDLVNRQKSKEDERRVIISLTQKSREMKIEAAVIPEKLMGNIAYSDFNLEELISTRNKLQEWTSCLGNPKYKKIKPSIIKMSISPLNQPLSMPCGAVIKNRIFKVCFQICIQKERSPS